MGAQGEVSIARSSIGAESANEWQVGLVEIDCGPVCADDPLGVGAEFGDLIGQQVGGHHRLGDIGSEEVQQTIWIDTDDFAADGELFEQEGSLAIAIVGADDRVNLAAPRDDSDPRGVPMLCQLVGNLGGLSWCTADAHEPVGASDALRVELGDNFEDAGIH